MPEGMVPELLIVAGFVVLIALAWIGIKRRAGAPPARVEDRDTTIAEVEAEAEAPAVVEAPVEAPSLRTRLARSRAFLTDRLAQTLGRAPDDQTWEDIEETLIQADVGVTLATEIANELRAAAREKRATTADEVRSLLAERLLAAFDADRDRALSMSSDGPTVWLVVGVNGTGKTTTIGKLARDLIRRERTVALAAADTFRAAADEQLGVWAKRAGAQLVKHQPGADPGAVAFDAYQYTRARSLDVLIVDTAGRLHTKTPLMDELVKVRRVLEKDGAVHESLLVIDATAGQNGLVQAREFAASTGVTGVVLSKLDGTAKGGIALAIENELGIPIKLIGVGEGIDDLEAFEPKAFVDALLS
jgi:fused signal recognition particle receptor